MEENLTERNKHFWSLQTEQVRLEDSSLDETLERVTKYSPEDKKPTKEEFYQHIVYLNPEIKNLGKEELTRLGKNSRYQLEIYDYDGRSNL